MAEENDEFSAVPSGLRKKVTGKPEEGKKPEAPAPAPKLLPAQPPWVRTPTVPAEERGPVPVPEPPPKKEEQPVVVREEEVAGPEPQPVPERE